MHILFSCGCIPDLALELLQRFGETLLGLWPWVMWGTLTPCRLPPLRSVPAPAVPPVLTLPRSAGCVCAWGGLTAKELMQVLSCCLGRGTDCRGGHCWWGVVLQFLVVAESQFFIEKRISASVLGLSLQHPIWVKENWLLLCLQIKISCTS